MVGKPYVCKHICGPDYYRNVFYFCGFYQCVNAGESLTNWVKPKGLYVKFVSDSPEFTRSGFMLSLWVIRWSLHIDKIHKNNNSFLIITNFVIKIVFLLASLYILGASSRKIVREIPAGIYRSVKFFFQPIKLHEISIMMRSWMRYMKAENWIIP